MTVCARRSAAMRAAWRRCGRTISWPASSKSWSARNPFKPADYEDAVMGCTNQAGEDARNVARHAVAARRACRSRPAALTVNRLCGSGLAAMLDAARAADCRPGRALHRRRRREHEPRAFRAWRSPRAPMAATSAGVRFSTIGARFPNPQGRSRATAPTRWPRPPTTSRASIRSRARTATNSPSPRSRNTPSAKAAGFYDEGNACR